MSRATITESYLTDIADAIREKKGVTTRFIPAEMKPAILSIPTGGITPTGTVNITQNGTHDVTEYANANVNVPNSYAAGDEGKVVSNGTLVAQTSRNIAANGAYDTTTNDEIVVSVAPNLQSKTVTQNGTVTPDQGYDGLSSVLVNVSGGGADTAYVGTNIPSSDFGADGDYYYRRSNAEYGCNFSTWSESSTVMSGYEFTANDDIVIVGLRAYVRGATTGNLYLTESNGNPIRQLVNLSFDTGWNTFFFDTTEQLVAGNNYIVQCETNKSRKLAYANKSSSRFSSQITGVGGRYGSLPGTVDSTHVYGADVLIATNGVYHVIEQYYKSSGTWEEII